jgi:hypothetical protein
MELKGSSIGMQFVYPFVCLSSISGSAFFCQFRNIGEYRYIVCITAFIEE